MLSNIQYTNTVASLICENCFKFCFINMEKYDTGFIDYKNVNLLHYVTFNNIDYTIVCECKENKLIIYFASSAHYSTSNYVYFKNLNIFNKIYAIFCYCAFYIFNITYLINLLESYLFNNNIGVRNRNCYNKGIFVYSIHKPFYNFIVNICIYAKNNNIKHIVLNGVSVGGSISLFAIGEIAKALLSIKYKIETIECVNIFSSGINDLLCKILVQNLYTYLCYSKYITKVYIKQLIIMGDYVSLNGRIFIPESFVKLFSSNIESTLYIVNTLSHNNLCNNVNINMHNIMPYYAYLSSICNIYVINKIQNIEAYFHLVSGGCNKRCTGNNKDLLNRFCNITNFNNKFFKLLVEYENNKQLLNVYNNMETIITEKRQKSKVNNKLTFIYSYMFYIISYNSIVQLYVFKYLFTNLLYINILYSNILLKRQLNKICANNNVININCLLEKLISNNYLQKI